MGFFSRRFFFSAAFLFLLPGMIAAPGVTGEQQALRPLLHPGEKAPAFSLRDVEGKIVAFRPGHGKPALLVFWSVFCPLCRETMPGVDRFAARHGDAVRVVAVNLDGKRFANAVRSWLKEFHPRYPVALDELGGEFFVASDPYGVEKTPTAVLVDGSGRVRSAWAAEEMKTFERDVDGIVTNLQKPPAPRQ